MNPDRKPARCIPDSVAEAAGFWDARLRAPDCTEADRDSFTVWRDESAEHREAFESLQTAITLLRTNEARADLRSLRNDALRIGIPSNRRAAIAAAVAAFAVMIGLWLLESQEQDPTIFAWTENAASGAAKNSGGDGIYQTGTGETSAVTLRDGSIVTLNARTRIRVAVNGRGRHVDLIDGQALFDIAKDALRPFTVRAADRDITALGTAFDVRLDSTSVRVTLLEGTVRITRDRSELPSERILTPGQQLVVRLPAAAETVVRDVDVAKVTGWRDGRIFLEDLTLAGAVAEMNRYSPVQISIVDPQIAELRVNGMFRAGEQDAFVTALQDYFPISARRDGDTKIELTRTR